MKKLFAALALAAALAGIAATAAGAAVVSCSTFHSDFTFFDTCSGENVHVVGDVDFFTTSTVNDSTISGTSHSLFKATGTGAELGAHVSRDRRVQPRVRVQRAERRGDGDDGGPHRRRRPWANGDVTSLDVDFPPPTCH